MNKRCQRCWGKKKKKKGEQGALEIKGRKHFKKKWQIMFNSVDK